MSPPDPTPTFTFDDRMVFAVDFNNFDDEGELLKGTMWHTHSLRFPRPGERVLLKDGEGNRCWATVRDVRGMVVYFELDDSTWVSGERSDVQTASDSAPTSRWSLETS